MAFTEIVAWSVILGLSLMLVGGLVLWAYGTRRTRASLVATGPEAEATRNFHLHLVRWFFVYGLMVVVAGAGLLFWSGSIFF